MQPKRFDLPEELAEWLRDEAFRGRTTQVRIVCAALKHYKNFLESPVKTETDSNGTTHLVEKINPFEI